MDASCVKKPFTPTTSQAWDPLRLAVSALCKGEGYDFDFHPSPHGLIFTHIFGWTPGVDAFSPNGAVSG
jgi:hypothetical protein